MRHSILRRAIVGTGLAAGLEGVSRSMRVGSGAQSQPIKVGLTSIISGRGAQLGITAKNGLLLEFDAFNAVGGFDGRTIELVDRDSKGRPEDAVRLTREVNRKAAKSYFVASRSAFAAHEVACASRAPLMHVISKATQLSADLKTEKLGPLPNCSPSTARLDCRRRIRSRNRPKKSRLKRWARSLPTMVTSSWVTSRHRCHSGVRDFD
jgi:hypothetical protein